MMYDALRTMMPIDHMLYYKSQHGKWNERLTENNCGGTSTLAAYIESLWHNMSVF